MGKFPHKSYTLFAGSGGFSPLPLKYNGGICDFFGIK